jgi:uncharacterized phiE125 gp8 family phage protein
MTLKIKTPAAIEPVSLSDALLHLRADSNTLAESLTMNQSIAPGAHTIAAAYSLEGTAVDVLGADVLAVLDAGTCGAGGSVACKLQHRDDVADAWADVTGGAFSTVTEANANAAAELAYTGGKRYIRPVATVAAATCDFSVAVLEYSASVADSAKIIDIIGTAREYYEGIFSEAYITQTWSQWEDNWPSGDRIEIDIRPLQSVASVKYYDTDDVEYTLAATEYMVDDVSHKGAVVLKYGKTWPTVTLRPAKAIVVEFDVGYSDTSAGIPKNIKTGLLLIVGHLYKHREETTEIALSKIPLGANSLLGINRLYHF